MLSVISASPGELEPVFQAMLENAMRISGAKFGAMFYCQDGAFRPAAELNVPTPYSELIRHRGSFQPAAGSTFERLVRTKQVVHLVDASAEGPFFSNNAATGTAAALPQDIAHLIASSSAGPARSAPNTWPT